MTWRKWLSDLLPDEENNLTKEETLPHESSKSGQSVNVPDTIEEMSHEEREAVFRDEILAFFVEDPTFDEEETNLIEAMKILYRVPDFDRQTAEWLTAEWLGPVLQSNRGRSKLELDAELYKIVYKRLHEPGHINLPDKNYIRIEEWQRYRAKESETPIQAIPETSLPDGTEDDSAHRTKEPEPESFGNRVGLQLQHLEPTLVIEDDQQLADDLPPSVLDSPGKVKLPEPEWIQIDKEVLLGRVEELLDPTHERIEEITEKIAATCMSQSETLDLAFGTNIFHKEREDSVIAVEQELDTDAEIWFAGDVHADLLGFEAVVQAFESNAGQNAKLIFLGDMIDRGIHDIEVVMSLWHYIYENPGRYGWLVGNHDEGLQWKADDRMFWSSVNPATFQDWLNQRTDDKAIVAFGVWFVALVSRLPRALFLPGLLAAHGGFPHRDTWPHINSFSDLKDSRCLGDFVWNRWTHSKLKRPNRSSSASTFGAEDFHGFRDVCSKRLGFTIEGMVRGHDHVNTRDHSERWERREEVRRASFKGRILTINTMSHNQRGDWLGDNTPPNPRAPTLARWRQGELLPTPVIVDLSAELVNWYAPECPNCHHPNQTGATMCERERCRTSLH